MSDLEKRISHLEDFVDEIQLEAHASRVAIAVMSTALNGLIGKETNLGEMYLTGIADAGNIEFEHQVPDGYQDKLNQKVAALLGKIK